MKKLWIVLCSVFLAVGVVTSQAAAYDYVYGGDAPDSSLYFTDLSGNYITGIENLEVGETFQFDVWISDIPTNEELYEIQYDLVFDPLVGFVSSEILPYGWGGTEASAEYGTGWLDANGYTDWGSQGLYINDESMGWMGIEGDAALMRLTFECLGSGDTTILPMFHNYTDYPNFLKDLLALTGYNAAADDTTWAFTYQDLLEAGSGYPTDIYDVSFGGLQISQQVPIPSAVLLLGSGLLGLFGIRRRSLP